MSSSAARESAASGVAGACSGSASEGAGTTSDGGGGPSGVAGALRGVAASVSTAGAASATSAGSRGATRSAALLDGRSVRGLSCRELAVLPAARTGPPSTPIATTSASASSASSQSKLSMSRRNGARPRASMSTLAMSPAPRRSMRSRTAWRCPLRTKRTASVRASTRRVKSPAVPHSEPCQSSRVGTRGAACTAQLPAHTLTPVVSAHHQRAVEPFRIANPGKLTGRLDRPREVE
jgi:trimeric autotransporter adhesin